MELTKGKKLLFFVAIMLSNIAVMGDCVIYPITYNIYNAFPESTVLVNYILSGPPLLIVIASLIAPMLLKKMTKKTLLILGCTLFTVGAVFGVAIDSVWWMSFTRTLVGVGQGFVNVSAIALITEVYDERVRAKYIGYFNASMNVVGVLCGFLVGSLAAESWQGAFRLYYAAIPMLVMVILFVPNIKNEKQSEAVAVKNREKMGFEFWELIVTFTILCVCSMVIAYFISVYAVENGIGDESIVARAMSISQVASFVGAMVFGFIYKKLKRWTLVLGYVLAALMFLLMIVAPSTPTIYIVYIMNSISYILPFSYAFVRGPMVVPESKADTAIGIVTAAYGIGGFLTTYFITFLMRIFNTELVTPILVVPAALCVIIAVVDTLCAVKVNKNVL